jgi:hypothetical protein
MARRETRSRTGPRPARVRARILAESARPGRLRRRNLDLPRELRRGRRAREGSSVHLSRAPVFHELDAELLVTGLERDARLDRGLALAPATRAGKHLGEPNGRPRTLDPRVAAQAAGVRETMEHSNVARLRFDPDLVICNPLGRRRAYGHGLLRWLQRQAALDLRLPRPFCGGLFRCAARRRCNSGGSCDARRFGGCCRDSGHARCCRARRGRRLGSSSVTRRRSARGRRRLLRAAEQQRERKPHEPAANAGCPPAHNVSRAETESPCPAKSVA